MQLLLTITGIVLALYILVDLIRRNGAKNRLADKDEFVETVLESAHSRQAQHDGVGADYDPLFETGSPSGNLSEVQDEQGSVDSQSPADSKTATSENEFVAVTVLPKHSSGQFTGYLLQAVLKKNNFHLGQQNLFHRYANDDDPQSIQYSVASIVEPGCFEKEMNANSYPGIMLFMKLPTKGSAVKTFEKMLTSARQLAAALNGELCDNTRSHLNSKSVHEYKERIKAISS